jgi:tRNA (guanine37-N1)-methyltransferase
VLLSGNHADISRWRRKEALRMTLERRPDLLEKAALSKEDEELLEEVRRERDDS